MPVSKRTAVVSVYALECIDIPSNEDVGPEKKRVRREGRT